VVCDVDIVPLPLDDPEFELCPLLPNNKLYY